MPGKGEPGPKVIKLFSCTTQTSLKLIMLIFVKMPKDAGILTFIAWHLTFIKIINITSESLKAKKA